MFPVQLGEE